MTNPLGGGEEDQDRVERAYLVASDLLSNIAQGSQNVQAELLALLIFEHGNILNMADIAEVVNAAFVIN